MAPACCWRGSRARRSPRRSTTRARARRWGRRSRSACATTATRRSRRGPTAASPTRRPAWVPSASRASCPSLPSPRCNPVAGFGAPKGQGGAMGGTENRREFGAYFVARRDVVRRTAYLLCGDWHWAEDLTQVAFVRLAAAWGRVRDPVALDAFVRTCLVRTYLAETRRVW